MEIKYKGSGYILAQGDSRKLTLLKDEYADSIVCDPPYELGFMNKGWDKAGVAFDVNTWMECYRILKPGGYLLAFGGTRTYHRMTCAIEDAGFEIRDSCHWIYGTGFPKSLNVSKAIDDHFGAVRESTSTVDMQEKSEVGEISSNRRCAVCSKARQSADPCRCPRDSGPVTDEAKKWNGYGTALKPAHEPIVLARKPLIGTVAENVLHYGTGALNIDATRISDGKPSPAALRRESARKTGNAPIDGATASESEAEGRINRRGSADVYAAARPSEDLGRWPANIFIDDYIAEALDSQIGKSRFFYVAKPSRAERDMGCESLAAFGSEETVNRDPDSAGAANPRAGAGRNGGARNIHPTVKPILLMQYLVKLVTPAGGRIVDPFVGSGSTACAAVLEGFRCLGVDLDSENKYLPIAHLRIEAAIKEKLIETLEETSVNA